MALDTKKAEKDLPTLFLLYLYISNQGVIINQ